MFKDLPEGSTHYQNDGCGEPAHNDTDLFTCRFHPTDSFHENGCPHRDWSKEELQEAIMTLKVGSKIAHEALVESYNLSKNIKKETIKEIEDMIKNMKAAPWFGFKKVTKRNEGYNEALLEVLKQLENL